MSHRELGDHTSTIALLMETANPIMDRLQYRLKRRRRDGTTHIIFASLELVEKLAALVLPRASA